MGLRLLGAICCVLGMLAPCRAATFGAEGDEGKRQFEVASVRENKSEEKSYSNFPLNPGPQFGEVGGVLRARNMVLLQYVVFAYAPNSWQIQGIRQGMPEWTRSARFDIEAKAAGPATKDEMRAMMRSLLEERFGMRVHAEQRETSVFALEMVKPGKLGPKMLQHPADDPECKRKPLAETVADGYPHQCGTAARIAVSGPGLDAIGGQNVAIDHMVLGFTDPASGVDRPVVNRTGLTARYDFTLEWAPRSSDPAAPVSEAGADFSQALREQLGLKVVAGKAPLEFLVVDKVERLIPN